MLTTKQKRLLAASAGVGLVAWWLTRRPATAAADGGAGDNSTPPIAIPDPNKGPRNTPGIIATPSDHTLVEIEGAAPQCFRHGERVPLEDCNPEFGTETVQSAFRDFLFRISGTTLAST